jgi:hypothetical protein
MKSSVGVTICAVVLLLASALGLLGAGGMLFIAFGPMAGQFFDPANLPPGANVGLMRSMMLAGAMFTGLFAGFGLATGIGMIRLWRWARYAAIVIGVIVIVLSVLPAFAFLFVPLPTPAGTAGPPPAAIRWVLAGFYFFWAALGGVFVYMMARQATVDQFNGGEGVPAPPRARPLSLTIIAWLMIVSGVMTLPMVLGMRLPALFLGIVLTGLAAKLFYAIYMVAYVVIGAGLIRRTTEALTPAIVLHSLAFVNTLVMLVPSVWRKYEAAIASVSPILATPSAPSTAGSYFGLIFGAAFALVILFFLLRARRTLAATARE